MQVILTEDLPNLGNMGDMVTVKPGYGRNYLIPRGFAKLATAANKKQLAHELRIIEAKREQLRAGAEEIGAKLGKLSVTISRKAGEDDRLFGSVTNRDIEAAISEAGIKVDRRRIILKDALKALGIYAIPVKLHADVTVEVKVWIVAA